VSGAVAGLLRRCRAAGVSLAADGNALHVDFERDPPGELIEELRRRKPEVMAALTSGKVTTPAQFFENEPPIMSCSARRGVIRYPDDRFEHFCAVCGAWGSFGYGVTAERPGRWFCFRHRTLGLDRSADLDEMPSI